MDDTAAAPTQLTSRLEAEFALIDAGADMARLTFLRVSAAKIVNEAVSQVRALPLYPPGLRNLVATG